MDGIDELKNLSYVLSYWRDDFARKFTAEQLLALFRVFRAGKWDICPDQWSERQVREALAGIAPEFDDNERPVYKRPKKKVRKQVRKQVYMVVADYDELLEFTDLDSACEAAADQSEIEGGDYLVCVPVKESPRKHWGRLLRLSLRRLGVAGLKVRVSNSGSNGLVCRLSDRAGLGVLSAPAISLWRLLRVASGEVPRWKTLPLTDSDRAWVREFLTPRGYELNEAYEFYWWMAAGFLVESLRSCGS